MVKRIAAVHVEECTPGIAIIHPYIGCFGNAASGCSQVQTAKTSSTRTATGYIHAAHSCTKSPQAAAECANHVGKGKAYVIGIIILRNHRSLGSPLEHVGCQAHIKAVLGAIASISFAEQSFFLILFQFKVD